jgi:hypothetical protein
MSEKFAKWMLALFFVIEIGLFTHSGEFEWIQAGSWLISEYSIFLVTGLIFSSAIAAFLVYVNELMVKDVRNIGNVCAILFVASIAILNHSTPLSGWLYFFGIIFVSAYFLGFAYRLYLDEIVNRINS